MVMHELTENIEKDFVVWDNKAYTKRPLLNQAGGEIMNFRHVCRQGYPDVLEVS